MVPFGAKYIESWTAGRGLGVEPSRNLLMTTPFSLVLNVASALFSATMVSEKARKRSVSSLHPRQWWHRVLKINFFFGNVVSKRRHVLKLTILFYKQ